MAIGVEVTELVQAREEARRARDLLQTILTNVDDPIILIDPEGGIPFANPAAARMNGFGSPAEMVATPMAEILGRIAVLDEEGRPLPPERFPVRQAIDRGETIRDRLIRLRPRNAQGAEAARPFLVTASPIRDSDGRVASVVAIAKDFTARKRAEQAVEDALHARDEFLSVASHELKTPLTTLKLQVQLRLRRITLGDREARSEASTRQILELVDRQIDRITRLVDDMLDVGRAMHGRLRLVAEQTDLTALARGVIERHSEELRGAGSVCRLDAPPLVQGSWDPGRIEQVLSNLLVNAIKYGKGRPIELVLTEGPERVRLEVRDQGQGIEAGDLARIFGRFERAAGRAISGLGLGLFISRRIVEQHGGTIRAESTPGVGSTFVVELPRVFRPA
jgi:PAS domain S-box-containing protein